MCGIGGILLYPKDRSIEELGYIKDLVANIAIENEIRGHDATGFAAFSQRGTGVLKYPMNASKFVSTTAFKSFIGSNVNNRTKNILIHTRAGTKGSEKNNVNNHPIESVRYVGVHNGIIYNDDELFESMKLHRAGQVDSEVIFRLLDCAGDKPDGEGLKWVAEKLQGAFTTAFVPKNYRDQLYLIRNDNPVTFVYIKPLNIIAFASMKHFLDGAIDSCNTKKFKIESGDCLWLTPKAHTIYSFNTLLNNPIDQLEQVPVEFKENSKWIYNDYFYYGDEGYRDASFFRRGAAEIAHGAEEEEVDSIQDVLMKLSDDGDLQKLEKYINKVTDNAWLEGWGKGRESLNEEMEHKANISYGQGYEEGFNDGWKSYQTYEKEQENNKNASVV